MASLHWHSAIEALINHPLFLIGVTIFLYSISNWIFEKLGRLGLLHPILVCIVVLGFGLHYFHVSYQHYFHAVEVLYWLLGTATVALAVPLFDQMSRIKALFIPIIVTLFVTGVAGVFFIWSVASLLGLPEKIILSLLSRSITTPIAIGVTEEIGGYPSLAAVFVIFVGLVGTVIGLPILKAIGVKDYADQGLAMGFSAHAIGTARAFQENEMCGAFAALGMGIMGLATAILLPFIFS